VIGLLEWVIQQSRNDIEKFEDNKIKEWIMGELFDMGEALKRLKNEKKVQREGWNGKGMWLMLQVPDEHSKMSLPYIYMKTVDDKLVPWLASQTDILAEDWREV
jgi:hypothetical protein